jgi:hypothetical protein
MQILTMKRIMFFFLIITISCQKEGSDLNNSRDEFVGNYCGEISGAGFWSIFNTTVLKSETDSNKIFFDYFAGVDTVEAIVEGYSLIIPERTCRKYEQTSAGPWGKTIYYDLTISGNGELNKSKYLLRINLFSKSSYENGDNREGHSIIEMYNSTKYSYIGTFTGDSTKVIISPYNDSLLLSVAYPVGWIPSGWDNIRASENDCEITFSGDSIKDILSGEVYRIGGGAQKLGDSLKFSLFAYYHGTSPIYIYNFTVTKEH